MTDLSLQRLLFVGLVWLTLWLSPGLAHGQSRELIDAANRSTTLNGQGRYQEAIPFAKKAATLGEQEFGASHPLFATLLNNLAGLYQSLGRHVEAEPLYERALAIRERALGPEHPELATVLNDLAELYRAQSRYAKSEQQYKRAVAIWEKSLGPEHPYTATGACHKSCGLDLH